MKNYIKMEISKIEFEDDIIITSEDCTGQDYETPACSGADCSDDLCNEKALPQP